MRRRAPVILAAVGLALSAAACGDDDDSSTTTAPPASASQQLPPVIVSLDSIDGTTVEVPLGHAVDLTGSDPVADWTAEIADEDLVTFVPGRSDGGAEYNPGLAPVAAGTTEVTMTNSSTDARVTFTVEVTED